MDYVEMVEQALDRLAASMLASDGLEGAEPWAVERELTPVSHLASPSYYAFMSRAGANAGDFLRGSDLCVTDLRELQELAAEVRQEEPETFASCRSPILVFLAHQGYQFLFVDEPGDRAPVYRYLEGEGVSRVADSFAEWLTEAVEDEIRIAAEVSTP